MKKWLAVIISLVMLVAVLLGNFVQADSGASAPGLLVYPYLGETTPTSVVISWATDGAGASEVCYSLDQSYSNVVAATDSTYDGKYWHSATITGLTADTTYYYRVYTDADDVTPWSEITFTTAPEPAAPGFTFVALGDSRPWGVSLPPSQGALDVAAEMDQHSFDLALHTGDIPHSGGICSGSDSSWNQYIRAYFDVYQESMGDIPFYPSVGNHELNGGDCGYQGYTDVYDLPGNAPSGDEEEYYSFDWGNAHFVALDTNQRYSAGSAQYKWLVSDLQASTQPWKFVFFHHPAYSSGLHGSTVKVQTRLVPVFEAYGVDVVFNGHDHDYERTCPILNDACTTPQDGGVVYVVTGGGGAPLYSVGSDWFTAYSGSLHHFLKMEVNDCWLRLDAIGTDGNVFDSYEIDHCGSPTPTPTATPEGSLMHVDDIAMATKQAGPNRSALATVTIVDANSAPVEGATVYGTFSGATNESVSGQTDSYGQVTLESSKVKDLTTWDFCVDDAVKSGWTYNLAANVETCDSTGVIPTPTPTATATPGGGLMHVDDIAMSYQKAGRNYKAKATLPILDANSAPVEGATVYGTFSGATNENVSGVTGADGQVTLTSSNKKDGGTWQFCVDDVVKSGWTYDPAANVENCDGITVP